ncbi:MAG: ribonuclease D, partial [Gemmatimonadetes bacterium]|nr:ribonuclease D [Gemmatimonadota bacterium]
MTAGTFPIRWIDTTAGLGELLRALGRPARVAVDTEAASYHRYSDAVCLLQLSVPDLTAVVDVPKVGDLHALGALLADPAVESSFHDADYDLRLLDRDHGWRVGKLFDTRIAAQLL